MHPRLFATISALLFLIATGNPSVAGQIAVKGGWARATPPGATSGAVYMVIFNNCSEDDELASAASPLSKSVGIHSVTMEGGMVGMKQLGSLKIPAGGSVELKPFGHHLMMAGLKKPLKEGATLELTLKFKVAGELKVTVPIKISQ